MTLLSLLSSAILSCLLVTCETNPTTTPPPPDCPRECSCTDDNLVVDCSNRGYLRLPPMSAHVTKLDLSSNLLGPMINGSLEHLRHLEEVDLSHNSFLRLQLCTFTGLLHLRKVDLHGNRLRSLPTGLFADNGQMEVLDLSYNQFDALPDLVLQSVPQLKVLNFSHNQATLLKLGLPFQILTQLTFLDLSHNPFTNASQDAFEMADMWDHDVPRAIDLSYCQLQNVHPESLKAVPGLKNLSLAGNSLLSLQLVADVLKELQTSGMEVVNLSNMTISDPGVFSEVRLMAVRELDLSRNVIESVPAATFGNIRSLRKLDISRNLLSSLDEGFEDLVNLVELNVSHCRLSSFKGPAVGRMQHLTLLDLSHNQLLDATEVDLSPLQQLQLLDLSFNTLQAVVLPGDSSHLVTLSFTSNALTLLPSMANMHSLKYFSASDNNLQSLSEFLFTEATNILVANFSNNDLTSIDHRAFLPASFHVIDLSNNFLTRTQFFSWTTTREVYLQNNKLNELDQQTFYGMDRLKVLDLRHNNLSFINDETFKFLSNVTTLRLSNNSLQMSNFFRLFRSMESLKNLDLGFNQIETINATSFQPLVSLKSLTLTKNKLKVIPVELFHNLEKLAEVDISGNPFDCDCELLPLQEWLQKTTIKIKQRFDLNITNRCVTPPEQRGKLVTLYTVQQFQCNTKMLYMIIFGSIGGLAITVGIISSIVFHYYNKWRKNHPPNIQGYKHQKLKDDNYSQKETNRNKVDLVRISKRPDPYRKQDLINGWVTSKEFTVAKQNLDPPNPKRHQPGPPRPPWPERLSGRNKKEEKGRKEKGKEKGDGKSSMRENPDKRIRSVSEMVPLRPTQRYVRMQSMVPAWDDLYYEKHRANLKPRTDRWVEMGNYPTWHQPQVMKPMYHRDSGRYYTLPYPNPWPRYVPYGPDYPYRVRTLEEEEEERYRSRQTRALPYPPRQDLSIHQRPSPTYGNNERYSRDPYATERARDYENLRDSREENWRFVQEQRTHREDLTDLRHDRPEHETYHQADNRYVDNYSRQQEERENGLRATRGREHRQEEIHENQGGPAMKRETSDVQVRRHDSEYRRAMDNPLDPKAKVADNSGDPKGKPSPPLTEDKASDWL